MNSLFPSSGTIVPTLEAPPGTRCLFHQASPPLGWVTDTSITDHALRVVTGAGGAIAGSTAATAAGGWLGGGTFNITPFALTLAQMPNHTHTVNSNHIHTLDGGSFFWSFSLGTTNGVGTGGGGLTVNVELGSGSSTTGLTSPTNTTGTGANISPNYTTPTVKFAAMIVAQKS